MWYFRPGIILMVSDFMGLVKPTKSIGASNGLS